MNRSRTARALSCAINIIPFATQIDRYFLREMITPFVSGLLIFIVILTGHMLYWALDKIINQNVPAKDLLLMMVYRLPSVSVLSLPIAMIIATSITLTRLGREGELMAFKLSGISGIRLAYPFLVVSLLVSFVDLWINERLVPEANHRAENILRKLMLTYTIPLIEENRFLKLSNKYFAYVRRVEPEAKMLFGVMIYELEPTLGSFPRVYIAKSATHENGCWWFHDVVIHQYDEQGRQVAEMLTERVTLNIEESIEAFITASKTPLEMSSQELKKQIEMLDRSGIDAHTMKIDYHFKFSLPAASFIMALWAAPLSMRFSRSGTYAGMLIAILAIFLYQGFMGWSRAIGIKYHLSPFLSAWSQNIFFGLMGLIMLIKER
ncbi:MAG: LptF/LptG family permease [Armatimonadota bacterium]|nr:LptF/LptG family permease [Armatimonadota bacterium]MCX7776779.1 LptF/LptG family permease [Armatimonadota bacterium]MDW8024576.1 LptF/LptG family permease [Armatimonadota bacterium]